MKKIKYFMFATAALLFAACSSDDAIVEKQSPQTAADNNAVEFSAYVNRSTRAGWAGELTTAQLQSAADGFGVFGYYTNGELYSETAKPDFMYNQHVTYTGGMWTYAPIKYWPNEFGNNAQSEEIDRLTFFAYAPYTAVTPTTGVVTDEDHATTGIVGMSRNTSSGNPLIKYYSDLTPANGVDLCWGVAKADFNSSVDGESNGIKKNEPYIDVMKPKIGDKIDFDFKHALAQLNVQIDADIDVVSHASSTLDDKTRIYVRSVTFEGFTTKGALDLNSDYAADATTPNWFDVSGSSKLSLEPITVYDGRRDGKEGVPTANAKNETPNDLNPDIIQSGAYTTVPKTPTEGAYTDLDSETPGVTNDAVNLFNSTTLTAPVLVIPTGEPMKVTIVYDVETADASLSGYLSDGTTRGSTIENAITQSIKLSGGGDMELASGKKYTIKLHLGMTSVKFEASVTDWDTGTNADVDLPINANSSTTAGSAVTINVGSAEATGLVYDITGFVGAGNTLTASRTTAYIKTPSLSSATVPENKTVTLTYGVEPNNTTLNRSSNYTITETGGSPATTQSTTTITINQAAHPIELGTESTGTWTGDVFERTSNKFNIGLTSGATGIVWASATVTVKDENGNTLTKDTDYTWDPASQQLTLKTDAEPASGKSKTLSITVKQGDAAAETIKVKYTKP